MNAVEIAVSMFEKGHSCSQAVFTAFAEKAGLDYATAVKIASGFGGGMGRMGGTCGALTGAFMALGLKSGGADAESKEKTYALVRRCAARFKTRHGSLQCKDLLGCDIGTTEGQKLIKEKNLHSTICVGIVQATAEILEELLEDS